MLPLRSSPPSPSQHRLRHSIAKVFAFVSLLPQSCFYCGTQKLWLNLRLRWIWFACLPVSGDKLEWKIAAFRLRSGILQPFRVLCIIRYTPYVISDISFQLAWLSASSCQAHPYFIFFSKKLKRFLWIMKIVPLSFIFAFHRLFLMLIYVNLRIKFV